VPDLLAIAKVVAIALVCGAVLAGTDWLTEDRIRYNEAAVLRAAIANLLPADVETPAYPPAVDRVPGAWSLCSGHLLGRSDVSGYGGDIQLLYTVRTAHDSQPAQMKPAPPALIRLTVLGHQETPGIADFLTDPAWLSAFSDQSAADIDGIDAITGATITSEAIREHLLAVVQDPLGQLGQPQTVACDK